MTTTSQASLVPTPFATQFDQRPLSAMIADDDLHRDHFPKTARAQAETREPESSKSSPRRSILFFRESGVLVHIDEIRWLKSRRNYVEIRIGGRAYQVRGPLKSILDRLDSDCFVQVHRSYVVQLSRVAQIRSAPPTGKLTMDDGTSVPISRGYRDRLFEILLDQSA